MSDLSSVPVPKESGTFAKFLESLAGSGKRPDGMWDDTALLDDLATISYEQALRSHRRVLPAALPVEESQLDTTATAAPARPVAAGKKRKSASITIRLTEAEQVQLKQRASAADLSISAYLRSCIFEAESLRAQVKEALARMQAPPLTAAQANKPPRNWHERFLSRFSHRSKDES